jgi:hypothetical protein
MTQVQTREKHIAIFYSPGTFFDETSEHEVQSWDPKEAIQLSETIEERYGAKPYGFRFMTFLNDGKVKKSSIYFLGGKVETYPEVCKRNSEDENILRSNMLYNKFWTVVTNTNSYKTIRHFSGDDVVVDAEGNITDKASNYLPDWSEQS